MTTTLSSHAALEPTVRRGDGSGAVVHYGHLTALLDDQILYLTVRHTCLTDEPLFQRRTVTAELATLELVNEAGQLVASTCMPARPIEPAGDGQNDAEPLEYDDWPEEL